MKTARGPTPSWPLNHPNLYGVTTMSLLCSSPSDRISATRLSKSPRPGCRLTGSPEPIHTVTDPAQRQAVDHVLPFSRQSRTTARACSKAVRTFGAASIAGPFVDDQHCDVGLAIGYYTNKW
jgi:hypothetical protein